jgi:hypothetical protein
MRSTGKDLWMRRHSTPASLMRAVDARLKDEVLTMRFVHNELAKGIKEDHAVYTSGRVPQTTLDALGNPFGRLGGPDTATGIRGIARKRHRFKLTDLQKLHGNVVRKGMLDPLPINRQTGDLRRSYWQTGPEGHQMVYEFGFRSDHRIVLSPDGTAKMVWRKFYSKRPDAPQMDRGIIATNFRARAAVLAKRWKERKRKQ